MNFGNLITREEMYNKLDLLVSKIKSISENKNILIITHDDLDGFVSAYCFEKYLESIGFKIEVKEIDYGDLVDFNYYCEKLTLNKYDIIIVLDIFDDKFLTIFEKRNCFFVDHHDGSKQHFVNENMINISNYFNIDVVPSMGAYLYGYTKNKINFPSWFSLVAKFTDGTYESNEFFIPLLDETENNYFRSLPRQEIIEFIQFINDFYNNPLDIDGMYPIFKECVDSGNLFYYLFSNSKDIVYLRNLKKKIDVAKNKLLSKCLIKNKIYPREKLVLFQINEKEIGLRRLVHNTLEYAFDKYNTLFLIKKKDGYVLSYRTNSLKFDVIKYLKPIYESYCEFGGHSFAAGGYFKSEFKKRFIKDTLTFFKKYYSNENKTEDQ